MGGGPRRCWPRSVVRDNRLDHAAARRTLRAYRAAGGRAPLGAAEAYGGLPDGLVYLARQAQESLDDTLPASMRDHSTRETCLLLADAPRPELFEELIDLGRRSTTGWQ